jgi:hypothetical protein
MSLKEREPVRSKITIDNKIYRTSKSNYLGSLVSDEKDVDIDNKLNNYFTITGITNNTFKLQKNFKENRNKTIQYTGHTSFDIR